MRKFAELVLKYRIPIIAAALVLTVFFGIGMTKVTINSDMLSYLKPSDPLVQLQVFAGQLNKFLLAQNLNIYPCGLESGIFSHTLNNVCFRTYP